MQTEKTRYENLGQFLDRCADSTVIDVYFPDANGVQKIPTVLDCSPTVGKLRSNRYLRTLQPTSYERYTSLLLPKMTGWSVFVPDMFDEQAFSLDA